MTESPTIQRVWKRLNCPKCGILIRVRYASDGTWILQDSKPSLHSPSESCDEVEMLPSALEEAVRKVVAKMDVEGFFNHDHEKEGIKQ